MENNPTPPLRLESASSYEAIRGLLGPLLSWCKSNFDEDRLIKIELCLAEALNNVVEHAYKEDPLGRIDIKAEQTDAGISVRIIDSGVANPHNEETNPVKRHPDELAEGGYGRSLVATIASRRQYERSQDKNFLTIWFDK